MKLRGPRSIYLLLFIKNGSLLWCRSVLNSEANSVTIRTFKQLNRISWDLTTVSQILHNGFVVCSVIRSFAVVVVEVSRVFPQNPMSNHNYFWKADLLNCSSDFDFFVKYLTIRWGLQITDGLSPALNGFSVSRFEDTGLEVSFFHRLLQLKEVFWI